MPADLASIHNCRFVDDRLATSGQPTVEQLGAIAAAGFGTVINLGLHDDPRYSLPDERGTVESLGMRYVHIPVQFGSPREEDLDAFFDAMRSHESEKTWIHCAANMRVSAFLGLYRVREMGWDAKRAFELMHGLWQPNAVWSAFIATVLAR
ncbi:MAG TPA: protein tyrosine phosphatase family protein [Ramlibacter sp.]|uniref:protein tyrosine phosphatase family protein n=1 Tax=Ramlibacter sp. TaxID=1917967 RepID=UPI002C36A2E6|nr:protein tyrosine phosphatase family protein [Ramlibacter sp.]HVZ43422.1 protein tyrosine phosphatase family protein [Ramlibacter sp.]